MKGLAKRFILVGLDGFQLPMARRFAEEGRLPNMRRLMERGACGELIPCLPSWTPTNWGTIATGAYPGTTCLSGWLRRAYDDLDGRHDLSTFSSKACEAETIWEAAERQGVRSLTVFHPVSWPPRVKESMVVAPLGPFGGVAGMTIVKEAVWSAKPEEPGWKAMEVKPGGNGYAARIVVSEGKEGASSAELTVAFDAAARKATVSCAGTVLGEAPLGAWSDPVWLDFGARGKGGLRFKLVRLDPANGQFLLYQSAAYPRSGSAHPERLCELLADQCGPFPEMSHLYASKAADLIDVGYEVSLQQGVWMTRVARLLLEREGWDLYYQHYHLIDGLSHTFLAKADPDHPAYTPQEGEKALTAMRRGYEVVDAILAEWAPLVDDQTAIMMLSDHGNSSNFWAVNYERRLEEVGLLTRNGKDIVWEKTKAYLLPQRITDIYINLKGRSPRGTVDPADYSRVQDAIIDALLDWRNPDTGERIVAYALKKQHAQIVGYYGKEVGDVVFVLNPHYGRGGPANRSVGASGGANHGPQIATAGTSLCSNLAGMILAGPGVRKGYLRDGASEGLWNLVDVVPTIAWMMGFEPPRHSRGGVMLEALER
ncbi:MAG: alkaline phosphatase family protein [Candidatus Sumerlaeota bacterium]|nr:alkaline phosphatase family protein [Candidatus Sumerlaeota bacterium]